MAGIAGRLRCCVRPGHGKAARHRDWRAGRHRRWAAVLGLLLGVSVAVGAGGSRSQAAVDRTSAPFAGSLHLIGSLPPAGVARNGGVITIGALGGGARFMLPIVPAAFATSSEVELIRQLYLPLYSAPDGALPRVDYRSSLASGPPLASDQDRSFTIRLKRGVSWSDGQPVDSEDVAFTLALMRAAVSESADSWAGAVRGGFPGDIRRVLTPNATTVVIKLARPVNPSFFLYDVLEDRGLGVYPLPAAAWNVAAADGPHLDGWRSSLRVAAAIYDYLRRQAASVRTFDTNRLWRTVDGPYLLVAYAPRVGAYDLEPNSAYSLSSKARAIIEVASFPTDEAEIEALADGKLDIAGPVDPIAQAGALSVAQAHGASVFGVPQWRWSGALINFRYAADDFSHVIAQGYVRAALAELVNQPEIIRDAFHGWAAAQYGPAPAAPASPFVSREAARDPYPYDPARAIATLRAHGWRVRPRGVTTCFRPGLGTHQCGAGIPKGTPITILWLNSTAQPETAAESRIVAKAAKRYAGISIKFELLDVFAPAARYYTTVVARIDTVDGSSCRGRSAMLAAAATATTRHRPGLTEAAARGTSAATAARRRTG